MKLHEQRTLQTHRHAMFALDVSQINWRTTVAHVSTEDSQLGRLSAEVGFYGSRRAFGARRAHAASGRSPPRPLSVTFSRAKSIAAGGGLTTPG